VTRTPLDTHWLLISHGRVTGCHCGLATSDEDHYGDAIVEHLYDMGFLDGINARSGQ